MSRHVLNPYMTKYFKNLANGTRSSLEKAIPWIAASKSRDQIFFIGLVIGLEHKGRPCKMCDSVRQKLGHPNKYVCIVYASSRSY